MRNIVKKGWSTFRTIFTGMGITIRHFFSPAVTLQYPDEREELPKIARSKLFVNIDDCIACDQCVRACPVNCIEIDTVKATADVDLGRTSDGKQKRMWVTRFDIDMAKCMYCDLCTFPCPTECIYMIQDYEYSEYDRNNLVYNFSNLSPEKIEEVTRKAEEDKLQKEQQAETETVTTKPGKTAKQTGSSSAKSIPGAKATSGAKSIPGAKPKTVPGAKSIPGAKPKTVPGAKTIPGAKPKTVPGAKSVPGSKPKTVPGAKTIPGSKLKTVPGAKSVPGAKTRTVPGAKTIPGAKPKTVPGAKTIPGAKPKAVPGAKTIPGSKPKTIPDAKQIPGAKAKTKSGVKKVPGGGKGSQKPNSEE